MTVLDNRGLLESDCPQRSIGKVRQDRLQLSLHSRRLAGAAQLSEMVQDHAVRRWLARQNQQEGAIAQPEGPPTGKG